MKEYSIPTVNLTREQFMEIDRRAEPFEIAHCTSGKTYYEDDTYMMSFMRFKIV